MSTKEKTQAPGVLLPFPQGCSSGVLCRRVKRFTIEFLLHGVPCKAHTNNSGGMLGLTRPGTQLWLSPAVSAARSTAWTLEMVRLGNPDTSAGTSESSSVADCPGYFHFAGRNAPPCGDGVPQGGNPLPGGAGLRQSRDSFWVGVNTLTPNRLLKAAFYAGLLPWASGYTHLQPEAKRGQSRLDALLTGPGLPRLWVECKNVTMVEDCVAAFPDAASERAQKHLREMMDILHSGDRAAFFYCVQRPDGQCFGPADYVDPAYASLYYQALDAGVEVYPHLAPVSIAGVDIGPLLPLAPAG